MFVTPLEREDVVALATDLSSAVKQLRRAESVSAYARTIREHIEQGDDVTRDGLRELFRENATASELIRWKDLYDRLQGMLDLIRRAAARTEGIAAKTG
jgi:uncharacterized protein Yka (UPF0111/DUF47 family)